MGHYRLAGLAILNSIIVVFVAIIFRQFSPSEIIFYQLISVAFGTTLFNVFVTILFSQKKTADRALILQAAVFSLFVCYSFFITVPALLDRSISLYLLRLLETEQRAASLQELSTWYVDGFVFGNEALTKRLDEQLHTGNIEEKDGCYSLTIQGEFTLTINDIFVQLFNTDRRYSNPTNYQPSTWNDLADVKTCK